jgi:CheY-like chemotaxis protein
MQQKISFFLIDDDIDDREIFTLALKDIDSSIKCTTAKDGAEALDFIENNKNFIPNFIFLDLNMPRINGKECLVEMRKIVRLQNIPIYIYTTSSSDKDKLELLNIGATGFITKPYTIKKLVEMLFQIISTTIGKSN